MKRWSILVLPLLYLNKAALVRGSVPRLNPATQTVWLRPFTLAVKLYPAAMWSYWLHRDFNYCRSWWATTFSQTHSQAVELDPKNGMNGLFLGTISNAKNDLIEMWLYAAQAGDMYTQIVVSVIQLSKGSFVSLLTLMIWLCWLLRLRILMSWPTISRSSSIFMLMSTKIPNPCPVLPGSNLLGFTL